MENKQINCEDRNEAISNLKRMNAIMDILFCYFAGSAREGIELNEGTMCWTTDILQKIIGDTQKLLE